MKCNRCGHEGFDPGAGICEHCHIVLYQSDVEAKDKRIAALGKALKEYGEHQAFCSASEHPGVSCDCGLDAALGEVDRG